jgi:hypothetical protein
MKTRLASVAQEPTVDPGPTLFGQTHGGTPPSLSAAGSGTGPVTLPSPPMDASAPPSGQMPSKHEPFTALDSATTDGTPRWTLAGNHKAEAGFQDPSLGWISVRAQSTSGTIHADVVAPTEVAAHVLNGHLEGLNAHMAAHYEHLSAVTVSTNDPARNGRDPLAEMSQGGSSDGGQPQGREHSRSGSRTEPVPQTTNGFSEDRTAVAEVGTLNSVLHTSTHRVSVVV